MSVNGQGASIDIAMQYAKYRNGYTEPFKPRGKITIVTNPNNNDTVVVGAVTYTFKTTISAANDVAIGTTARDSAVNLYAALINGSGEGTKYYAGTVPAVLVDCQLGNLANVILLTYYIYGTTGHTMTLTTTGSPRITVSAMAGGIKGGEQLYNVGRIAFSVKPSNLDTVTVGATVYTFKNTIAAANDVFIGATRDTAIANLIKAINLTGVAGTDYGSGTVANASATAAEPDGYVVKLTAKTPGVTATINLASSNAANPVSAASFAGGQNATEYDRSTLTWRGFMFVDTDYGERQMQDIFPLEAGGTQVPTGPYKSGAWLSGGFVFQPRMQDDLGWLLLALLGDSSTVNNTTHGVHTFKFKANDETNLPWVAVRKKVPGRGNVLALGTLGYDNIVSGLTLTLNPASILQARAEFFGRVPKFDQASDEWVKPTVEDYKSAGLTCLANFKLPSLLGSKTIPLQQLQLVMSNSTTTEREEMIIGEYHPDDVISLTRSLRMRFVYKWESRELYERAFGGLGKSDWSPTSFITTTVGSDKAFDLNISAPFNIPGTTIPYSLRIYANEVVWQPEGPPATTPGQIVMQAWSATVLYNATSYVEFVLTNGRTSAYTLPTEP